jgi:hypothetical protein
MKKASSARRALFSCPRSGGGAPGGVMPRGVSANPGRAEKPRETTRRLIKTANYHGKSRHGWGTRIREKVDKS